MTITLFGDSFRGGLVLVPAVGSAAPGPFDGWTSVLTIPAAAFTAGHSYLLIASGLVGDCVAGKTDPALALRVEVSWREGGGSYWSGLEQRIDPTMVALIPDRPPFSQVPRWGRGFPFIAMIPHAPVAAQDLELIARFAWPSGKVRGVDFQADFCYLDQISVMVWDLTVIGTSPLSQVYRKSYASSDPVNGTALGGLPLATILAQTGIPGGAWLIAWSALIAPESLNSSIGPVGRLWTTLPGVFPWANDPLVHFGQAVRPNRLTDRYWMGQAGIFGAGSSWTAEVHLGDDSPTPGRLYRAELMVLDVGTAMDPWVWTGTPAGGDGRFWSQPYQGDYTFQRKTFTDSGALRRQAFFFSGRASAQVGCRTRLEVDSGALFEPRLGAIASRTRTASKSLYCSVPSVTGAKVEIGIGAHSFALLGDVPLRDYPPLETAENVQSAVLSFHLFAFAMGHDSDPPVSAYETPGPPIAIVPGRETALDPAHLPELPIEPTLSTSLSLETEIREIEFALGYRATHPKYLKARRVYSLSWQGMTRDECNTLAAFFRSSALGGIRWRPPGAIIDTAWILNPRSITIEGFEAISATFVELTFVAEEIV
ncbi:MAG: hypothetical protein M0R66_04365 [Candidatus Omnitrophica bacterium]|jgi:hypothetical protein|nr:hypothetical protein [Candidatus Omnitrophota bacterium]